MKVCRGSILLELLIGMMIVGILFSMGSLRLPKGFSGSEEEAPVIFLGALNESMRMAMMTNTNQRLNLREHQMNLHESAFSIRKRLTMEVGTSVRYFQVLDPSIQVEPKYIFHCAGSSERSGKVYFRKDGVTRGYLMIHVGTMTLDYRSLP